MSIRYPITLKPLLLVIAALFSFGAFAEGKIAVCDLNGAIFSTEIAKKRVEELKASSDLDALQAEGEGKVAELQALQKDAETNSLSWSDEEKAKYKNQAEYLAADIQLIQRKLKKEQQTLQQQILKEIYPKATEQLDALIKEEGIVVLLRPESTVWAGPTLNLTAKLIERINKNVDLAAK